MKNYEAMTNKELNDRIHELSKNLDNYFYSGDSRWDETYKEYCKLTAIQNERYRQENEGKFKAFYEKRIQGKKWEEIDPADWDFYSDWHKDMYGYRPRTI